MDQASQQFLGRTKELSIMRKGLDQAFEGHGGNILIAGEAGIGKTSLAEILDGEARSRGAIVTWGRCWEGGGSPSYWPWTQALRALGAVYEAGADASESQQLLADFVTRHARDTSKHFKEEELRF